jgi:hypothetical protein
VAARLALALAILAGCAHAPPVDERSRQAFAGCVAALTTAADTASHEPELQRGRLHVFVEDVTYEQTDLDAPFLYAGFARRPPPHAPARPDTAGWSEEPPDSKRYAAERRTPHGTGFLQARHLSPAALDRYLALFRPAIDRCLELSAAASDR